MKTVVAPPATGQTKHRPALRTGPAHTFSTRATYVLIGLMAVGSALGLIVDDLYPEDPWAVAAFQGNDLVTLALVVPFLALGVTRSSTSTRWMLVWMGGLMYGVYNFAYYSFGAAFNDVFLLHVAGLTTSMLAAIGLAASIDSSAVAARFVDRSSDRVVAAFMVFVGGALTLAWAGFSLRFALTGLLPDDVMPPAAVHLVYALDLSLLAPSFLAGGLLLWRRAPWGRILAVAVNLFGAAYLVVLEFVGGYQANAGIENKTWLSMPSIGGAISCALAAYVMLRAIEDQAIVPSEPADPPPDLV